MERIVEIGDFGWFEDKLQSTLGTNDRRGMTPCGMDKDSFKSSHPTAYHSKHEHATWKRIRGVSEANMEKCS